MSFEHLDTQIRAAVSPMTSRAPKNPDMLNDFHVAGLPHSITGFRQSTVSLGAVLEQGHGI